MSFAAPFLLILLVLVPLAAVAYVWLERHRGQRAASWATPALTPNMLQRPSPRVRHIPAALFLLGLLFLVLGIARPQAKLSTVREGATIVLAVDRSGSMDANDVKPTRLLAARAAVYAMLQKLPPKYRVALITFTDHPAVVVPPTYDRTKVEAALPTKAIPFATDIGDAVQAAVTVAVKTVGAGKGKHPPATVVLISDGLQNIKGLNPATAAKNARRLGVPVSTVLVGTDKGAVNQVTKAP